MPGAAACDTTARPGPARMVVATRVWSLLVACSLGRARAADPDPPTPGAGHRPDGGGVHLSDMNEWASELSVAAYSAEDERYKPGPFTKRAPSTKAAQRVPYPHTAKVGETDLPAHSPNMRTRFDHAFANVAMAYVTAVATGRPPSADAMPYYGKRAGSLQFSVFCPLRFGTPCRSVRYVACFCWLPPVCIVDTQQHLPGPLLCLLLDAVP
jgi:hypothetical protein